jgi:hypothetical protein
MKNGLTRIYIFAALLAVTVILGAAGCGGPIDGPRFWYDDRNQTRLEGYELPRSPDAPAEYGIERRAMASGEDLSEDDLDNYRTDLGREEEERKAGASLVDF